MRLLRLDGGYYNDGGERSPQDPGATGATSGSHPRILREAAGNCLACFRPAPAGMAMTVAGGGSRLERQPAHAWRCKVKVEIAAAAQQHGGN